MQEVIQAFGRSSVCGGICKIMEILTFKRFFFLSMDKNNTKSGEKDRLYPLITQITNPDLTVSSGIKVCLSQASAWHEEKSRDEFYSQISRADLLKLCKSAELEPDFSVIFSVQNKYNDILLPFRAEELIPILSKRDILSAIKNFFKTGIGISYLVCYVIFFLFCAYFLLFYKISPFFKQWNFERRERATISRGHVEYMNYDENGRLLSVVNEDDRHFWELFYKNDKTYERWFAEKSEKTFEYDENGKLVHEKIVKTRPELIFDSSKNLVEEIPHETIRGEKDNSEIWYKYDKKGQNVSSAASDGKKTFYEYDKNGRLSSSKNDEGEVTEYEYDEKGRLIFKKKPKGNCEDYVYDSEGRIKEHNFRGDKDGLVYNRFAYKYDEKGNLSEKLEYTYLGKKSLTRIKTICYYNFDENGNKTYENLYFYYPEKFFFKKSINSEAWFDYDFWPDGKIKRVTKYYYYGGQVP